MENQIGDTRKRWFVSWHQHKCGDYFSECLSESFASREDAIQHAKDAFKEWGTSGHPDYKGLWWSVCEVTEEWDGFDWQDKDADTVYETEKCE